MGAQIVAGHGLGYGEVALGTHGRHYYAGRIPPDLGVNICCGPAGHHVHRRHRHAGGNGEHAVGHQHTAVHRGAYHRIGRAGHQEPALGLEHSPVRNVIIHEISARVGPGETILRQRPRGITRGERVVARGLIITAAGNRCISPAGLVPAASGEHGHHPRSRVRGRGANALQVHRPVAPGITGGSAVAQAGGLYRASGGDGYAVVPDLGRAGSVVDGISADGHGLESVGLRTSSQGQGLLVWRLGVIAERRRRGARRGVSAHAGTVIEVVLRVSSHPHAVIVVAGRVGPDAGAVGRIGTGRRPQARAETIIVVGVSPYAHAVSVIGVRRSAHAHAVAEIAVGEIAQAGPVSVVSVRAPAHAHAVVMIIEGPVAYSYAGRVVQAGAAAYGNGVIVVTIPRERGEHHILAADRNGRNIDQLQPRKVKVLRGGMVAKVIGRYPGKPGRVAEVHPGRSHGGDYQA